MSTVHFFIFAPTRSLISYIRVLSSNCGVVLLNCLFSLTLFLQWTLSQLWNVFLFQEHAPRRSHNPATWLACQPCSDSVTHTHQVTQDPYYIWQLLLVTCLCCSAACVGDQLHGFGKMINTPTGSGSCQLWNKVKVMALCKVDVGAVLPRRQLLLPA